MAMKRYTVYDNESDTPVAIHETSVRAAQLMHVQLNSFYSIVTRSRTGKQKKWSIIVEDEYDDQV